MTQKFSGDNQRNNKDASKKKKMAMYQRKT